MKVPVIIDCDTGVDDAVALICALASDRLDIRAITTNSSISVKPRRKAEGCRPKAEGLTEGRTRRCAQCRLPPAAWDLLLIVISKNEYVRYRPNFQEDSRRNLG